jgi:hypothetical protein
MKMNILKKFTSTIVFCIVLISSSSSQPFIPGQVYFGRNNYIEYHAGNLPLIFSAPHGGSLTPSEIPDRTYGTFVTDSKTKETTIAIGDAIFNFAGRYPHLIICNLKRTKLDANRDIIEGAQGNQWAEIAWNEFHEFIQHSKDTVNEYYGKGLYLDIHGHGHDIQRLELGYLLSTTDLLQPNSILNTAPYINSSSIRSLSNFAEADFASLIRGEKSLGTLFELKGISSVPSLNQPDPGIGNPYFTGGYNTQVHGSQSGGTIDGLQIEAYRVGLRDTPANRAFYAQSMTEVLDEYLREHYGWDGIVTDVEENSVSNFTLENLLIYPNPFNSSANIKYVLQADYFVTISLFNSLGQRVEILLQDFQTKGEHKLLYNAGNHSSGVYFLMMQTESGISRTKFVLLK